MLLFHGLAGFGGIGGGAVGIGIMGAGYRITFEVASSASLLYEFVQVIGHGGTGSSAQATRGSSLPWPRAISLPVWELIGWRWQHCSRASVQGLMSSFVYRHRTLTPYLHLSVPLEGLRTLGEAADPSPESRQLGDILLQLRKVGAICIRASC